MRKYPLLGEKAILHMDITEDAEIWSVRHLFYFFFFRSASRIFFCILVLFFYETSELS